MTALSHGSWRDARRGRMLEAAGRVFARRPFAQVSMDEVAHEAGVGKPTLYRYFAGKDAIFLAVFEQALDELEAELDAVCAQSAGIADTLPLLIRAIAPTFRDHLVSLRLLGAESTSADLSKRRLFRDRRARIAGRIESCIADAVTKRQLRPCRPGTVAEMVIGMIWSATATGTDDDAGIAAEISGLLLHGLVRRDGESAAESSDEHSQARVA